MKFISWNVNSICALWNHGLHRFLQECKADFICLQETKVNSQPEYAALNGYESYWAICDTKKGYAGTVIFAKHRPIHASYHFNDKSFVMEGRVITLEYDEFFLVNAYFPRPHDAGTRYFYRQKFDSLMRDHLARLRLKKPVIVCGDFNVPLESEDVYRDSPWRREREEDFRTPEQDSLCTILGNGYVDTYRHVHPDKKDRYTFWSNRWSKRRTNEGWRIDYFLVTDTIAPLIQDAQILDLARGSDHCPITLELSIEMNPESKVKKLRRNDYTYSGLLRMESRQESLARIARLDLTRVWETFDVDDARKRVREMQRAIALAVRDGHDEKAFKLQVKLMMSLDARFLAMHHVATTARSVGIDDIEWTKSNDKAHAALAFDIWGYKSLPAIIVKMKTKGDRVRNTSLLAHHDRAMDKIAAYALSPVAATSGDLHSYAFREGRGPRDFVYRVISMFDGRKSADFAVIIDVQRYYDSINHDYVLNEITLPGTILREFLKAGFIENGDFQQTEDGIPIGSALSPIIGNMVLDGLEPYLEELREKDGMDERSCEMARWADDIVISAGSMKDALAIKASVESFLAERGLQASFEKSKVVDVHDGFDVLSKNFIKNSRGRILCTPTERSAELFLGEVADLLKTYRSSQDELIKKLNRMLDGWFNFHKYQGLPSMFRKVDTGLTALLLDYAVRRHPRLKLETIKRQYFDIDDRGRPFYSVKKNRAVRIKFLADAIGVKHDPVDVTKNPFINTHYFEERRSQRDINNVAGKYKHIFERQKGKCAVCGKAILVDQPKSITEIVNPNSPTKTMEAYVHVSCANCAVINVDTDVMPFTVEDTRELLMGYISKKHKVHPRYMALLTFLQGHASDRVVLAFDRIERIIDCKLGNVAQNYHFWQVTGSDTIGQCFREAGFLVDEVCLAPINEVSLFRYKRR